MRATNRDGESIDARTVIKERLIGFKKTLSGSAPHHIKFVTEGFPVMADASYRVFVQGETVARVTVDESTIATTGFDLLLGADTEVVHILVHGLCSE
jgi:hypothetical protein